MRSQAGQGLVEYTFVLMLIALVAVAVLQALGTNLTAKLQNVLNGFGP
ncbi:MAG: Flp family type IVb pilin [Bacillota bacterium]